MPRERIPDLLDAANSLEHGVKEAMFSLTMAPTNTDMAVITPAQLLMSCGNKDTDHLNIKQLKIHDLHITGDPLGTAGIVFHGKNPIATAHRATHIDATGSCLDEQRTDCVHAVATAAGLNHPITLDIGPSANELGVKQSDIVRLGVARAARWEGLHPTDVEKHPDIAAFERDGETRRLIPLDVGATSSPMAKLWNYNESNRDFMGGRYLKQNRTEVNNGVVVSEEDFLAGQKLLKKNLTPLNNYADVGLVIRAIPVVGQEHTSGQIHMRFGIIREPLTHEQLSAKGTSTGLSSHPGVISVSAAQLAIGETAAEIARVAAASNRNAASSETDAEIWKASL